MLSFLTLPRNWIFHLIDTSKFVQPDPKIATTLLHWNLNRCLSSFKRQCHTEKACILETRENRTFENKMTALGCICGNFLNAVAFKGSRMGTCCVYWISFVLIFIIACSSTKAKFTAWYSTGMAGKDLLPNSIFERSPLGYLYSSTEISVDSIFIMLDAHHFTFATSSLQFSLMATKRSF